MKENLRHIKAFELFYSLGGKASDKNCREVAGKLQISERTFWNWYKKLNWREKVDQRNIENSKKLIKKTDETVLDIKANYRAEIKAQFSILKKMLNELINKFKEDEAKGNKGKDKKSIEIKDVPGLKDIMGCYERLVKMDLTLIGEVSEREEIALKYAEDKFFDEINSIIAREKKAKSIRKNKKSKRKR